MKENVICGKKVVTDAGDSDVMKAGQIVTARKLRDDGLWEGSLRVFDDRMTVEFSDHAKTIGECVHCQSKTSNFENCANMQCNELVLICEDCKKDSDLLFHTDECRNASLALQQ